MLSNASTASFTTTWDCTTLKLSRRECSRHISFTTTWDCTTLKLPCRSSRGRTRFTTTWDCTTLKQNIKSHLTRNSFTTTWDCTTLKLQGPGAQLEREFYYHLGLHYSQTSNFKTAGISFGKMGKLAVFLRFGAALRHYNGVSGGSKTIIAHESKFAKVFVDDPHLLTGSDRLFLSALQQENGQFFIKHRLIKKRYFILRKE